MTTVIGFLDCLHKQQKDHLHPNFLAILNEVSQIGDNLVPQILLDESGPPMNHELIDIQKKHKEYLMVRSQILEEHKPPGSNLEQKSFLINERYVNLVVVSIDQFRRRPQNELIQTGRKHEEYMEETQTGLEHISTDKLFRWSRQSQCNPRAVMVSGVPGIGKTTMMQKFLYDWVTGKLYQRFAFVFFYRFRELNTWREVSLEEMILHQYPYLEGQLENILYDSERILFIFDGLDEITDPMNFRLSKLCFSPKQRDDVGTIVVSLVRQTLLRGSSVLMTSRPTRLASIDTSVFQRVTEILGFFHKDRQIYFENFFENKELSEKAFSYVKENDMMYTFCYIPAYCWIICTVLSACFRIKPTHIGQLMTSLPKTVTQLFVAFISNILANHNYQNRDDPRMLTSEAREILASIGWLAEHGVMNHIIVFDKHDLESFSLSSDKPMLSCFMVESGHPPNVDHTFLHLTLQEFFAALVHFIDYNPDKLQESLKKTESYEDGRCEIFLRFLCGLSDNSTRAMLKPYLGELSPEASRQVITWLQRNNEKEQIANQFPEHKRALLDVFYCLHESRNKALVLQCIGSNNIDDFSNMSLNPLDCSVLSFILQFCEEMEKLHLNSCCIKREGLRKLAPVLHHIKNLSLQYNKLTHSSCIALASGINDSRTLKILNLSHNKLEGPHLCDLMMAVKTSSIEVLLLEDNKLNSSSCLHLATGIKDNRTLKTLILSNNNLEGPNFGDLMAALTTSRIEKLGLGHNRLTPSSCVHLESTVRSSQTLRSLDLSDNNLGDLKSPHFTGLMAALKTSMIEELLLQGLRMADEHAPLLASLFSSRRLRVLNIHRNKFTDAAASYIKTLIMNMPSLKEIRISSIYISERTKKELKALEQSRQELQIEMD
ncbi:NACHT, LRR and PYD domains-containing protein 12-like isoform X2 [Hyperolius riggenbachi]|uniref:NACHT, LRR and PYD domains-containing protein 12-like isoform X2 n=1 Tax=Hyperolius riggenbachi TaxID=752182 RepID=UPI0035A317E0